MGRIIGIVALVVALVAGGIGYFAGASGSLVPRRAVAAAACQTFPQTGKTVCDPFLTYWTTHGGLAQQGLPLSDTFQERSDVNGQTYTVQYFERAVFEAHPENAPPYDVLLSLLGREKYLVKYPNGPGPSPAPSPTAKPSPAPSPSPKANCDPSYPTVCIPPPPPDLDCKDIPYRRFQVLPPDPHGFDADHDGIGCE